MDFCIGGEGEIRTPDQVSPMPVFETGALGQLSHLSIPQEILFDLFQVLWI